MAKITFNLTPADFYAALKSEGMPITLKQVKEKFKDPKFLKRIGADAKILLLESGGAWDAYDEDFSVKE